MTEHLGKKTGIDKVMNRRVDIIDVKLLKAIHKQDSLNMFTGCKINYVKHKCARQDDKNKI